MHIKHKFFYTLTAIIAAVDICLFLLPYFEEDVDVFEAEPPLPKNDFRRMINFWKGTGAEGFKNGQLVRKSAKSDCDCDPINSPSKSVKCYIGPKGAMQTTMIRVAHDLQFKCKRMTKKTCQCCDCGTEEKTIVFTGKDIKRVGICAGCEKPVSDGKQNAAHFAKGEVYQMLFKMPLGCGLNTVTGACLQYDYQALNLDIRVEGNFSRSWDNDLMIGFMDGASTVWSGQRGDNGIWFNIGKYKNDGISNITSGPVGIFHPHSLGYARYGSRASRFGIRFFQNDAGNGATVISMDHDLTDNKGKFKTTTRWRQSGWKSTGRAKDLQLVAFRDDGDEVYEIHKVTIKYQKSHVADPPPKKTEI